MKAPPQAERHFAARPTCNNRKPLVCPHISDGDLVYLVRTYDRNGARVIFVYANLVLIVVAALVALPLQAQDTTSI